MKVLVAQLCSVLCDPMTCQAPLPMGFSRQEYWSGLPFSPPGDLPNPGVEPRSPAWWAGSFLSEHQGSPGDIPVGKGTSTPIGFVR